MEKEEWVGRPIDQRRQWYDEKISGLISKLREDKPEADNKDLLQLIKKRMIYDGTPSGERLSDGDNQEEKKYYEKVYNAYKALPNIDDSRQEWPERLKKARQVLK